MNTNETPTVTVQALTITMPEGAEPYEWFAACPACNWYGATRDSKTAAESDAARHRRAHRQERPMREQHLAMLARIQTQRVNLEADQYAAVLDARLEGASWGEIGQALGLTKQAVQQRYSTPDYCQHPCAYCDDRCDRSQNHPLASTGGGEHVCSQHAEANR